MHVLFSSFKSRGYCKIINSNFKALQKLKMKNILIDTIQEDFTIDHGVVHASSRKNFT